MRQDADLDQRIARRSISHSRAAFAFQTQNLAIPRRPRNVDVQRGPVREDKRLLAAIDGIEQGEIEVIADILAPPAAVRTARAAEYLRENIFAAGEITEVGKAGIVGVGGPAVLIGEISVILLAWLLRA